MPRFLIDIGHGLYTADRSIPFDRGAVAPNGCSEFSLNVLTASNLYQRLRSLGHHADTMTIGLTRSQRGRSAQGYDCLVSIHHNASKDHTAQGTEVCLLESSYEATQGLALSIAESVARALGIHNRGLRCQNLEILRAASKTDVCHAILTEGFFIDSGLTEQYMRDMCVPEAFAIADALHQYFGRWNE